ncbi:MAG: preprotein translocase subunit SecG [Faecalibacterium sp.]|nr:preprotein translocase subunit SecG [Ruminococcus sp.]MCM1392250.1 preprotein translocase subunit SecG [Ruminococcus sp.]MCM1484953.1 preprotein translocase subunit SecG [Faecalibacterium sp.]
MTALQYVLSIVTILLSIIIIALVMLQESKQQGLSGAISGAADTFFGKNKGRTMEAKLAKFTKIAGVVFFIIALVSSLLVLFGA